MTTIFSIRQFLFSAMFFVIGLACGLIFLLVSLGQDIVSPFSARVNLIPSKPKSIGFIPYWLVGKASGSYQGKITELSYFSLSLDSDGTVRRLVNAQEEEPGWTTLNRSEKLLEKLALAKAQDQSLSLVVFSGDGSVIKEIISDPASHAANLVNDIAPIMKRGGFTDLNLDLESSESATDGARTAFTRFVSEVKKQMIARDLGTLTLDVQSISLFQPYLTDPVELGKISDFILIMAYDFHYPGSILTGPVAPLGGAGNYRVFDVELTLKAALKLIPKQKIILGIPLYGYEWNTLASYPGAPAIPGTGAIASDNRVVSSVRPNCQKCILGSDPIASEPYVIFPEGSYFHQIFYEDSKAIDEKLALAKKWGIGGVAFWALGYESATDLNPLTEYIKTLVF